jgi:hypothetical protein
MTQLLGKEMRVQAMLLGHTCSHKPEPYVQLYIMLPKEIISKAMPSCFTQCKKCSVNSCKVQRFREVAAALSLNHEVVRIIATTFVAIDSSTSPPVPI